MKDSNYIWRIEDGGGGGAYQRMCYGEGKYYGDYHPGPGWDDMNGDIVPDHRFGFADILMARRWFTSVHDLQDWERDHHAKLVVYRRADCHNIVTGKSQIVFIPGGPKVSLHASDLHRLRVSELVAKVEREFSHLHAVAA